MQEKNMSKQEEGNPVLGRAQSKREGPAHSFNLTIKINVAKSPAVREDGDGGVSG